MDVLGQIKVFILVWVGAGLSSICVDSRADFGLQFVGQMICILMESN